MYKRPVPRSSPRVNLEVAATFTNTKNPPTVLSDFPIRRPTYLLQERRDVPAAVTDRPRQRRGPRLIAGQISLGAAFQQELDHPPPALGLLRIARCAP